MSTDLVVPQTAPRTLGFWYALSASQRTGISLGLVGGALLLIYHRTLVWLCQVWWNDPRFSHGFLVPLIAVYLVWIQRDRLTQLPHRPRLAVGGLVLLVSSLVLLAGRIGGFLLAEAISLLIVFPGIVLSIWGFRHFLALLLPLGYLQFMIPWTQEFFESTSWPLQLFTARVASFVLAGLGYPVFRDGTYLQVSQVGLEVVSYCSGIGFVTSVIALGIPLVFITQRTWWRAAAVLVCGVVLAILSNGVRVALMGVMTYHYGESMLHGPLHVFQGLFASQAGILFLFLANWGATKLPSDRTLTLHRRWKGAAIPIAPARRVTRTIGPPVVLVSSFLLLVACYIHFFASPQPVPLKQPLSDLPYAIDGWRARDSEWIEGSRFFPGATAEIRRTYHAGEKTVFLYVGYFASQRQGGSLITVHATPIAQNAREVPLPQNLPGLHRVNHSAPTLDGKRYEALFWYHSSSGKTLGRYETKLRQILGAVLHGRNNGAVVLLAAPASGPDRPTSIEDLMTFSTVLAPVLDRYLP